MAKKKNSAKVPVTRPRTSPYASPPITLRVGSELRSYYVQEALLQNLKHLPQVGFGGGTIDLPDVNAHSAHIIVHFLHTGTYQTLVDGEDEDTVFNASKEFHKAALVYVAARKYGLDQLKELAKAELERWGADIDIAEIVRTIGKKVFAALQDDSSWFETFVLKKAEKTFTNDEAIFSTNDFFTNVASSALARLLAQHVVKLYHNRILELRKGASACEDHSPKQNGTSIAEEPFDVDPPAPSEEPATQDSPSAPVAQTMVSGGALDSSTEKKKKKKKKAVTEESSPPRMSYEVAEPELEPVRAEEPGSDIAMHSIHNVEENILLEPGPELVVDDHSVVTEAILEPVDPVHGPTTVQLRQKMQEGIRLAEEGDAERQRIDAEGNVALQASEEAIAAVEPGPAPESELPAASEPEPVEEPPTIDPFAGLSRSQTKKLEKKMKKEARAKEQEDAERKRLEEEEAELKWLEGEETELKRMEEEESEARHAALRGEEVAVPEPEAKPVLETEAASEPKPEPIWEASAVEVEEAVPIVAQEEQIKSLWGALAHSKTKEKKKKKKGRTELECPPPPPPDCEPEPKVEDAPVVTEPTPVEEAVDPWVSGWGVGASSSGKKKELITYDDPQLEPEAMPGSDLIEPDGPKDHCDEAVPAVRKTATENGYDCALRLEHLSEGDGWRTCKPCEDYVRQIAHKLQSAGYADVNGFSRAM